MFKIILLFLAMNSYLLVSSSENSTAKKKADLGEKAIFAHQEHYQDFLQKRMAEQKKKKKVSLKIYKRRDGSIDTLKTINEANP
jgi:hypothetical protein